jgi:aryl-alcohol dehydrogenase-like predicted oxidoreductase
LQGGTAKGDPAKDIIKTAFEYGINMFDTAENYDKGQSEREVWAIFTSIHTFLLINFGRGRIIQELGFRRSDIVVTTKIFWGSRPGPNNGGLSRKQ